MTQETLKLALEALELAQDNLRDHGDNCFLHDEGEYNRCFCGKDSLSDHLQSVVEKLDEALAEQSAQQEPVATDWERIARVQDAKLRAMCNEAGGFEKLCEVMDRYERTTPPQRKPLTDEQRERIAKGWRGRNWTVGDIIDATEAAHGIKENT